MTITRYTEEEREAIEQHIEKHFGPILGAFRETVIAEEDSSGETVVVDVYIVPPTPERNFYSLITVGAGAYRMKMPKDLRPFERAEFCIFLPPSWPLEKEEAPWDWPRQLLQYLGHVPSETGTWLGWGSSLHHGLPFSENPAFTSVALLSPFEEARACRLPNNSAVTFYCVEPLYEEEWLYKSRYGMGALLELFLDWEDTCGKTNLVPVLDTQRPNLCKDMDISQPIHNEDEEVVLQMGTSAIEAMSRLVNDMLHPTEASKALLETLQPEDVAALAAAARAAIQLKGGETSTTLMKRFGSIFGVDTLGTPEEFGLLPQTGAEQDWLAEHVIDIGDVHKAAIIDKELPVDPLNAYSHIAIFLRFCMEKGLMGDLFLQYFGWLVEAVQEGKPRDLRRFLEDECQGMLLYEYFSEEGQSFVSYYYHNLAEKAEDELHSYTADVDKQAKEFFGEDRYYSDEFKEEAYLFVPYEEAYYQRMLAYLEKHYEEWQALYGAETSGRLFS